MVWFVGGEEIFVVDGFECFLGVFIIHTGCLCVVSKVAVYVLKVNEVYLV